MIEKMYLCPNTRCLLLVIRSEARRVQAGKGTFYICRKCQAILRTTKGAIYEQK